MPAKQPRPRRRPQPLSRRQPPPGPRPPPFPLPSRHAPLTRTAGRRRASPTRDGREPSRRPPPRRLLRPLPSCPRRPSRPRRRSPPRPALPSRSRARSAPQTPRARAARASEGNVVLGLGPCARPGRFLERRRRLTEVVSARACTRTCPARRTAALPALSSGEEDDLVRDHLGRVLLHAFLVGPLSRLQPALQVHLAAFAQVLTAQFRELGPDDHAVPFGAVLLLARLVGPRVVGRDGKVRHCLTIRRVAHLGILPEMTDQDHFVDASSHEGASPRKMLFRFSTRVRRSTIH